MIGNGGPESSLRVAVEEALERNDGEGVAALVSDLPLDFGRDSQECLQSLKTVVDDDPALVEPALPVCETLLTEDGRSVRLTTAKLFVAAAETHSNAVVTIVPALAEWLTDGEEFYYVHARSEEALGYTALDHPDTVTSPELLADQGVIELFAHLSSTPRNGV